jgi:hypothetical protein
MIENALDLANRYVSFQTLVHVCEINEDYELLKKCLDKFSNKVLVAW